MREFRVGDRVRVVRNLDDKSFDFTIGHEGTITELHNDRELYNVVIDPPANDSVGAMYGVNMFGLEELELIDNSKPLPLPG
jgi:hypothetical protein